jgi:hypothetical protein
MTFYHHPLPVSSKKIMQKLKLCKTYFNDVKPWEIFGHNLLKYEPENVEPIEY